MTTREFTARLNDLALAFYDEKDLSTALQFLYRIISTTRDTADLIRYDNNAAKINGIEETLKAMSKELYVDGCVVLATIQKLEKDKEGTRK